MDSNFDTKADASAKGFIPEAPAWIVKYGISVIAGMFILLLLLAAIIQYPDRVPAPVYLTTATPPVDIAAPINGNIKALFCENSDTVSAGQILAVMESPGDYSQILKLDSLLHQPGTIKNIPMLELTQLGPLESHFANLKSVISEQKQYADKNLNIQRIHNLRQQIQQLQQLNRSLQKQRSIYRQEAALSIRQFHRDSLLYASGTISSTELETSNQARLFRQRELEKFNNEMIENELRISNLKATIINLHESEQFESGSSQTAVNAQLQIVRGALQEWKNQHLITAVATGRLSFSNSILQRRFVSRGATIFTILPIAEDREIIAIAALPFVQAGKVETGMTANLKLSDYPFREYGILKGSVMAISPTANSTTGYEVKISLNHGMRTTYDKQLKFRNGMQGVAEIITEKRSFLERIFNKFRSLAAN